MFFRVNSWLDFHNEVVAVIHFARIRVRTAADLWIDQSAKICGVGSKISAKSAHWNFLDVVWDGVVCLERQHRTYCGFLNVQAVYAFGVRRDRDFVVRFHP